MVEREKSLGRKIREGLITASFAVGMLGAYPRPVSAVDFPICLEESEDPKCNNNEVWDGYWWRDIVWIPSYPSIDTWFRPAPDYTIGGSVFYENGSMEANADYRNLSLKGYKGGVALMSPADIGLPVWMRAPGGNWEGPFLVVDCATRGDIYPIIKYRSEVVEVSWQQAQKWGMIDNKDKVVKWRLDDVEVSKLPPDTLEEKPIDYQSWWLNNYQSSGNERIWTTPSYRPPSSWFINGKWVTFESPTRETNYPTTPIEITKK